MLFSRLAGRGRPTLSYLSLPCQDTVQEPSERVDVECLVNQTRKYMAYNDRNKSLADGQL